MKKLPNFVKWLIIAVVLAAMAAMMVAVNVNQKNETGLLESGPVFA